MNRMVMWAGAARSWWQGRAVRERIGDTPAAPEKTLRELMAERGLDENGRRRVPAGVELERVPVPEVILAVEFSYDGPQGAPSHLVVRVVGLDDRGFRGFRHRGDDLQSFVWSKVRGLMRLVDSGEMIEPQEVIARYC